MGFFRQSCSIRCNALLLGGVLMVVPQLAESAPRGVARSADYSLDYCVVSAGGAHIATTDYDFTDQIAMDSAVAIRADSATYVVEGLSAAMGAAANSSVAGWELY